MARSNCCVRVSDRAWTRWKSEWCMQQMKLSALLARVVVNYNLFITGKSYATYNHEVRLPVHHNGAWKSFTPCQEEIPQSGSLRRSWSHEWKRTRNYWRLEREISETFKALVSCLWCTRDAIKKKSFSGFRSFGLPASSHGLEKKEEFATTLLSKR